MSRRTKVCLRFDAGADIGMGHAKRCQILSRVAPADVDVIAAARCYSDAALDAVHAFAPEILLLDTEDGGPIETPALLSILGPGDIVLFDVTHIRAIRDRTYFKTVFTGLAAAGCNVAVIDGLDPVLLVQEADWPIDVLFSPYAGARPVAEAGFRQCLGPRYFVASPEDTALNREPPAPTNILITMGGSDPSGVTLLSLHALDLIDGPLSPSVVIGPDFAPELVQEIEVAAAENRHNICLLHSPESMATLYADAGIVVSTTGLTKYEVALAGRPSIQISHDETAAVVNDAFAALGTARHLGAAQVLSARDVAEALDQLIKNENERSTMRQNGLRVLDGHGADRIWQEVTN